MPIISTLALYIGELYCFLLARDFIDAHFARSYTDIFINFRRLPRSSTEKEGESERMLDASVSDIPQDKSSPIVPTLLLCIVDTNLWRGIVATPEQKAETVFPDTRLVSVSIVYLESCPANERHQFRVTNREPFLAFLGLYIFRNQLSITRFFRFNFNFK